MPISDHVISLVNRAFRGCFNNTECSSKKTMLERQFKRLLEMNSDEELYNALAKDLDTKAEFGKAIDIKTGLGKFTSSPSATRVAMDKLSRDIGLVVEHDTGKVALGLLKDTKNANRPGLADTLAKTGAKNKLLADKAYIITPSANGLTTEQIEAANKAQDEAKVVTKADLFNLYNKSGLDYKGQSNYASQTLLKGGGLDVKVNLFALFLPPAAALGFSGSVKVSANLLTGSHVFIYSEVINGNNGEWQIIGGEQLNQILLDNIANELVSKDGFFDKITLTTNLAPVIDGSLLLQDERSQSVATILEHVSKIYFDRPPEDLDHSESEVFHSFASEHSDSVSSEVFHSFASERSDSVGSEVFHSFASERSDSVSSRSTVYEDAISGYTTQNRNGGAFAPDLCEAVGTALAQTSDAISKSGVHTDPYTALVISGCMKTRAWEWMGKCGLEVGWNLMGVKQITQAGQVLSYLKSSSNWSNDAALQTVALGVSAGASAEGSIGCTRRSFFASDPAARIFAKGSGHHFNDSYTQMSEFIANSMRLTSENAIREYVQGVYSIYYQSPDLSKLKTMDALFDYNVKNIMKTADRLGEYANDPVRLPNYQQRYAKLKEVHAILEDEMIRNNESKLTGFCLAYTGTTWEFAAKVDAKLGITFKSLPPKNDPSYIFGAKGPEFVASLLNACRAYRTSRYTLQVPLIRVDPINHSLPSAFKNVLAGGNGIVRFHDIPTKGNDNPPVSLLRNRTQETSVAYKKTDIKMFEKIGLEMNAIPNTSGIGKSRDFLKDNDANKYFKTKLDKNKYTFINTISYETAVAVWEPQLGNDRLRLCKGTGRCYGEAYVLNQLIELGTAVQSDQIDDALKARLSLLASSLHISSKLLEKFFKSQEYRLAMPQACLGQQNPWAKENFAAQEGCILIETTFALKGIEGRSLPGKKGSEGQIVPESFLNSSHLPEVDPDTFDINGNSPEYTLQSIRIRYRLADLKDDKRTPFKLGLYLPNYFEVGIRLEEVENAGMSGIVDVCTFWYEGASQGSVMYNRDETVVATVLITQ